jgi:hypothetical protein
MTFALTGASRHSVRKSSRHTNRQSYSGGRQTRPDKSEYFFPFFAANLFTPIHTARNA